MLTDATASTLLALAALPPMHTPAAGETCVRVDIPNPYDVNREVLTAGTASLTRYNWNARRHDVSPLLPTHRTVFRSFAKSHLSFRSGALTN